MFALITLVGCATLGSPIDTPSVKLLSIAPQKSSNLSQSFQVTLQVANPNAVALDLVGLSYDIEVQGVDLISGLASDIPSIPAYGEETVTVSATLGLFQAMALVTKLVSEKNPVLDYSLNAKLDTGIPLVGKIPVSHTGLVDLKELVK